MNYKDFEVLGLNETESKIYLAILNLGEALASQIADKSEVKRTTAYLSLHSLKKKGLISQAKKNGGMRYFAEDPRILEKIMKKNNERFAALMPEITSTIKVIHHKPSISYFVGKGYLKKIYSDILNHKRQEVLAWLPGEINPANNKYFEQFNLERQTNRISLKAIVPNSKTLNSTISNHKINKTKFSPKEILFENSEIYIYSDNKIGIISTEDDLSIIIENKNIHKAIKGIFDSLWSKI